MAEQSLRWALVPNPTYQGREPTPLVADCHDGTPFITIQCACGEQMHQHESRIAGIPADAEVASHCPKCSALLVFPPGWFQSAFTDLRRTGWLADTADAQSKVSGANGSTTPF